LILVFITSVNLAVAPLLPGLPPPLLLRRAAVLTPLLLLLATLPPHTMHPLLPQLPTHQLLSLRDPECLPRWPQPLVQLLLAQ
jgi:hypothetical protein